ncbi:hypothetical protein WCX18_11000 [Sulfurimonas sp. HSL1-2]|uniref:WD40 repeat domain-containing protein n=1 Tax=Thiomicrolovo zhangzhouensis TaxID=3131933 RepID=UPI0031F7E70C
MKKISLLFMLSAALLIGREIGPAAALTADGLVTDILVENGELYAATYGGKVDVFDIAGRKKQAVITIPNIIDFMGDEIPAKIYSIDKLGDVLMLVSEGKAGYRNVYLYQNEKLKKVIDSSDALPIKRGVLVDEDHMLLGLLSSEIILYRISTEEVVYRRMIKDEESGGSAFGDMTLSEDRKTVVTADESGDVNVFRVSDFSHMKLLRGQNVDNIYKVDYRQGVIITAGQDRRCAVYKPDGTAYYMEGDFLIYAAALTPSANRGIFAATVENDVALFDIAGRTKLAELKGHTATLTDFAFVDEDHFFSSAEETRILYWDIETIK